VERGEQARCAECGGGAEGELFLYLTEQALDRGEADSICARCFSRKGEDRIVITRRASGAPAVSPDTRFEALLKAGRVLWREQISDENKIIPTLRLAHRRGWRAPRIQYSTVRVVAVVEGVPILERVGVTVRGRRSLRTGALTDFAICLWPCSKIITPEEIAGAYKQALKAEGVKWGRAGGRITYDLMQVRGYYLLLAVERSGFSEIREENWPPPSLVGKVAQAALEEFSERLVIRRAGGAMKAKNLIPAMVAYLMRNSLPVGTEVAGRKDINVLLNRYVLPDDQLLEVGYSGPRSNQLWENVRIIAQREEQIPDSGPYEIK